MKSKPRNPATNPSPTRGAPKASAAKSPPATNRPAKRTDGTSVDKRPTTAPKHTAAKPGSAAPLFIRTPADLRRWFEAHASSDTELQLGLYKTSSGKCELSLAQAVEEALCFGWIDGKGHSIDAERWTVRFTPRKPGSNWSLVNVRRVEKLRAAGLMTPAGEAAFARRQAKKTGVYSFENRPRDLEPADEKTFRANAKAWTWWQAAAPSYRRAAIWWVVSAKQEATRARRLAQLIQHSANAERIPPMREWKAKT